MINIISCVTMYKGKPAIGVNENLLFYIKQDMAYFKQTTTDNLLETSKLNKNIVLMGRKTYNSLPVRPLTGRINLILTRRQELIDTTPLDENLEKDYYYINMSSFDKIYEKYSPNVFIIGGGEIYKQFISITDRLYITHIEREDGNDIIYKEGGEPNVFFGPLSPFFKLETYSPSYKTFFYKELNHCSPNYKMDVYKEQNIKYRFLEYKKTSSPSDEFKYLVFMNNIIQNGNIRDDRTGTGTVSLFGNQMKFDIRSSIPLITTKKVNYKHIIEELLWFCRGDTDSKILENKGINIWKGNTSRAFLDKQGLTEYDEGILGAGYGWQIRHQGAKYDPKYADSANVGGVGVDQLGYIENLLQNDPFSRRIMMSYWNPSDFDMTALLPCHYSVQFYVEEIDGDKYISCHFTMRSNDMMCGWAWNIASYSILTYILAHRHGFKTKEIIYSCGDSHIYTSHIEAVKRQLLRNPRPFPVIELCEELKTKDWSEMTSDDFDLVGYFPHPYIKADMVV